MFHTGFLIFLIFCKSIKFQHVFFVQVSYPKSISKEAKDICKGVSISVVNVIISISINIVLTVTPSDKDSIRGKNPVKDTKLKIN